jgi:hypothetical protein
MSRLIVVTDASSVVICYASAASSIIGINIPTIYEEWMESYNSN